MNTTVCTPFGARCEICSDDPRILAAMAPSLTGFPDLGLTDQLTIEVRWVPDGVDDPAWPTTSTTWDGRHLELVTGSARLTGDAATGQATITLCPSVAAISDAVQMMLEGAVSALLIGRGRLHAVHTAMVSDGSRSVLLRGQSGAGKSTLTYACLRAGLTVISDDWSYHVDGTPPGLLAGYPWRIFLMPDTVAWFPELAAIGPVAHPGGDRIKLPVFPPPTQQLTHAHADAVVFLEPGPGDGPQPIPAGEAVERFWASALPSERSDLPADFIEQLMNRPTFRLGRGNDPRHGAEHVQRVIASL